MFGLHDKKNTRYNKIILSQCHTCHDIKLDYPEIISLSLKAHDKTISTKRCEIISNFFILH